ncbi:hypothetical protein [Arthrospira platensis]|uniref:hypothetical protein n=1 Tax=Limnospira platensis TaxID=118562 RepID=UPI0028E132BB|nr:hypothetical protein [Arthrospira platensis PCC 7345]
MSAPGLALQNSHPETVETETVPGQELHCLSLHCGVFSGVGFSSVCPPNLELICIQNFNKPELLAGTEFNSLQKLESERSRFYYNSKIDRLMSINVIFDARTATTGN